ncbi:UDP-glucose 4-epimerase GalE [Cupriavidus sp. KK10]|jgi:UDP-glucose 4-epimerase|uniref:UDP-glucose 4-epimerase GalE n=1 Tax=Cupriavidus sp. KK10 TaxID=1478019 RepID=UPI001BA946F5|nr:UDP-glucose 4-epimerase GalE [Cupriavidus sp. KK10]QUN26234.1 UDP-glucose 4-epimerase GalE [Cupriavidus sp. KK10]
MPETLLLTGATGYIASHTWVALLNAGYHVIGLDNLCNSSPVVLERLATITGQTPHFVQGDVRDRALLDRLFAEHRISGVIHFAALKAVGESVSQPLEYYSNNLGGLLTVCAAMGAAGVKQLVFSSSATVYGNPHAVPILEDFPLSATNPYGQTKLMGEQILRDLETSDPDWRIAYLRYFNPVGAHESGLIGEDPRGVPNNLMPYVAQVAGGRRERLMVFGGDYPTPDGTGVRDYIHVCDLADGHLAALGYLRAQGKSMTVNLGTGCGYSVLEVVQAYQRASGKPVPHDIVARRPGDIASCYADPALANQLLGWRARHDIDRMCEDSWRWQSMNPQGFDA